MDAETKRLVDEVVEAAIAGEHWPNENDGSARAALDAHLETIERERDAARESQRLAEEGNQAFCDRIAVIFGTIVNFASIRASILDYAKDVADGFNAAIARAEKAEQVIDAAWKSLGTTAEDSADDPDTASLADSIRVSFQYEREKSDIEIDTLKAQLAASEAGAGAMRRALVQVREWLDQVFGFRLPAATVEKFITDALLLDADRARRDGNNQHPAATCRSERGEE